MATRNTKVACGTVCYQDKVGLQRAIESCYEHIDTFIVVDGRYPSWGASTDPEYSTDGTEEYCKSLDKVDYYKLFADQPVKRTLSFARTKDHDCDFLIVLDADDFIHRSTDWNKFYEYLNTFNFEYYYNKPYLKESIVTNKIAITERTLVPNQTYAVEFITDGGKNKQIIGRLFYKPYELEYISHWQLVRRRDGKIMHYPRPSGRPPAFLVPGLVMSTDDGVMRSKERLSTDITYQWDLFLKEGYLTPEQHKDIAKRNEFAESIINEYIVWEKYYKGKTK